TGGMSRWVPRSTRGWATRSESRIERSMLQPDMLDMGPVTNVTSRRQHQVCPPGMTTSPVRGLFRERPLLAGAGEVSQTPGLRLPLGPVLIRIGTAGRAGDQRLDRGDRARG